MSCQICGKTGDLFAEVTGEAACSICVLRFGLATPVSPAAIATVREALKLKNGDFLVQDHASLASQFLGRASGRRRP